MKKIALLTLLLINLSLSFSLPRNQASPAIFSVTKTNNSILFRHTDSTLTAIPCQSVASIVSNADPSKIVSVWVVQQGDYDKIMQFDYSVCGFSSKSDAVDSLTAWAICDTVGSHVFVSTDSATVTQYNVLNSQNAPPGSPATGDTYLVGNSPSGAWVGHAKDIAEWDGADWVFTDGVQGDFLYNSTTALTYIFRSGNWVQTTGIPALNNGNTISSGLRIGTNNARSLTFETNNVNRGRFDSIGRFHVYNLPTATSADTFIWKANASGLATKVGQSTFLSGGAFIPLTGTEVGSPVTGDIEIEFEGDRNILSHSSDFTFSAGISFGSGILGLNSVRPSGSFSMQLNDNGEGNLLISSSDRGIVGSDDYTANITDLDYTQKIYVDNAISSNRKVDTSYIFRNSSLDSICQVTIINGLSYRSCAKDSLPTVSSTSTTTFTNKRITARVDSTTSSATPTINTDNIDTYKLTAQAVDITSFTTNLSGTPTDDQILHIIIKGTGARTISWGSSFEASTVALPTTTVSTDRLDVYFVWNTFTSKWRCGGVW